MAAKDMFTEESEVTTDTSHTSNERDEIEEVRKLSSKETARISRWRLVMAAVLLTTALIVTLTTFGFLTRAQNDSFKVAVRGSISIPCLF